MLLPVNNTFKVRIEEDGDEQGYHRVEGLVRVSPALVYMEYAIVDKTM